MICNNSVSRFSFSIKRGAGCRIQNLDNFYGRNTGNLSLKDILVFLLKDSCLAIWDIRFTEIYKLLKKIVCPNQRYCCTINTLPINITNTSISVNNTPPKINIVFQIHYARLKAFLFSDSIIGKVIAYYIRTYIYSCVSSRLYLASIFHDAISTFKSSYRVFTLKKMFKFFYVRVIFYRASKINNIPCYVAIGHNKANPISTFWSKFRKNMVVDFIFPFSSSMDFGRNIIYIGMSHDESPSFLVRSAARVGALRHFASISLNKEYFNDKVLV